MKNIKILDIDLDFFLNKKHTTHCDTENRLDTSYVPWTEERVKSFLETNCRLSQKVKGKYFTHHDEAFYFLSDLQKENNFQLQFSIDHVDAHADLGFGGTSYNFISSELLFRDVKDRISHTKTKNETRVNKGNFLAFLIAYRWVSELNYINKIEWANDLPFFLFKDFDTNSNFIQLKKYSAEQIRQIIYSNNMIETARNIIPLAVEPEVQFKTIDYLLFSSNGVYDYIFLTQSPNYTPESSDILIPTIQEHMIIE